MSAKLIKAQSGLCVRANSALKPPPANATANAAIMRAKTGASLWVRFISNSKSDLGSQIGIGTNAIGDGAH